MDMDIAPVYLRDVVNAVLTETPDKSGFIWLVTGNCCAECYPRIEYVNGEVKNPELIPRYEGMRIARIVSNGGMFCMDHEARFVVDGNEEIDVSVESFTQALRRYESAVAATHMAGNEGTCE